MDSDDELPELVEAVGEEIAAASDAVADGKEEGDAPAVPVTLITGFLGAGKTTLLNHLLTELHGRRIAVIENEFGEDVDVERLVMKEGAVEIAPDLYQLSNGCICCSVKDDLVATLEALMRERSRFDAILIETTGMADPAPLAGIFWLDDALEAMLQLDGIITVVDSRNIVRHLVEGSESPEAVQQLAYADRIILNKRDLVDDEALAATKAAVRRYNAVAELIVSHKSAVDVSSVMDVRAFDASAIERRVEAAAVAAAMGGKHSKGVGTVLLTTELPLDLHAVKRWIAALVWEESDVRSAADDKPLFFRYKGVLSAAGESCKHVLQGVHDLFEITTSEEAWEDGAARVSRLVIIGKCLDGDALQTAFEACVVNKEAVEEDVEEAAEVA